MLSACGPPRRVCRCLQDEANELETELLQELFTHLLLQAGQVYQQRQEDDSPVDDAAAWDAAANADEDSDEELETDEAEDEEEKAHAAALKRSKQKHGFKLTKGGLLIALIAMMLLGELFVMIDMLWRK